ncbi:bifunctional YncE family protein/alkaline phosphatase family protein [Algoriphagus antarcticus]|uniref:DNA-binding beta-propeller fold protein YncE n=1 Tax=Algoriphagus antarcticus TaxID=238540 RepID=A0A3E0DWI4_9BACT|nr:bifunctional YncE family protein/alkaline phosphatase family protein [Algoriphagus antarcticus]REG90408.1 DNA-binding beta-propeller fold protein YncE [Algoriphagus antarcticus]
MRLIAFSLVFIFSYLVCYAQKQLQPILEVPAKSEISIINEDGTSVLPSGRTLTPAGELIRITHDPFGLAISPDGKKAISLHNGVFTVIHTSDLDATRVPSYDRSIVSPLSDGSFLGVAFDPDNKTIYLSGGDNGAVIVYDVEQMIRIDSISLNGVVDGKNFEDSFTSDLVYQNNELLVLDRGNFRMVRYDLHKKKITASIPVGRQPFGLAISPDHKKAFVANVGMYSYSLIEGLTEENYNEMLISRHPYADNSKESIEGTIIDGKTIPGVGDPLSPDAMSVFTIDLTTNTVINKYKTGSQIGEMVEDAEVVGGASPNSIAVGEQYLYVTNATNDNIAVIDHKIGEIVKHIPVEIDQRIDRYRGSLPFGITLSKDEKTLYVALLGMNAVAVIDIKSEKTLGLIPTGWGPTRVRLSEDEKEMYVISCRGLGAGPNGGEGFVAPPQGTYIGDIQLGSFQKIAIPNSSQLASYTKQTIDNTFREVMADPTDPNPLPIYPGAKESPIKHIVYITKENRTFDEVFGQMEGVNGDKSLARFGINAEHTLPDSLRSGIEIMKVTPNHHKAAKQFALSDNFYCDSDASIHGHHWMVGVIPNEWVESNSSVDKTAKLFSPAPGRRFPGSTGSMDPEDYAEIGGLWEAMERKGLEFYNFGEANETAHVRETWSDTLTGAAHGVMVPMQKALFSRTSTNYAGYNMNIPDQFRMNQFEEEFTKMWLKGEEEMPSLITVQIPNDHTASPRPEDGYFSSASFVADNDLAVGRILHFLSRTTYWKDMLVIITEDDPQGGVDHIDAHRSILMMAGPYVKRGQISHTHANFGSILKTIYNILGVPYVNQYDVTASLLQDFFTSIPDYTPYTVEPHDPRVFNADKAMQRYNKWVDWKSIMQGPEMDDVDIIKKEFKNN